MTIDLTDWTALLEALDGLTGQHPAAPPPLPVKVKPAAEPPQPSDHAREQAAMPRSQ